MYGHRDTEMSGKKRHSQLQDMKIHNKQKNNTHKMSKKLIFEQFRVSLYKQHPQEGRQDCVDRGENVEGFVAELDSIEPFFGGISTLREFLLLCPASKFLR